MDSSPLVSTGADTTFTGLNVDSDDDADTYKNNLGVPGSVGSMGLPALSLDPSANFMSHELFDRSVQVEYHLATDSRRFERLISQHKLLTMILGKYPPPLIDVLQGDTQGPQKAVLDLGCGTGAWLAEIASDFSHVDAVGVDLVPPQVTYCPENVRTEVDNINLGLEHFYGQFNVVNARLISTGIKDYASLVDQISHVLRPDGLVILCECDFHVYDHKMEPLSPPASTACSRSIPAVACCVEYLRRAMRAQGGHVDAASWLHHWLGQHRAFRDIVCRDFYFPLCPFMQEDSPEATQLREIGLYARENILAVLDTCRPLLLKSGLLCEEIDDLLSRAEQELIDCRITCYMRLQHVHARRRS